LRYSFLTQAQGREVATSGQPHSLTDLFPGKKNPPLAIGCWPHSLSVGYGEEEDLCVIHTVWLQMMQIQCDFQHYNTLLQQAHFSAYMFIFCANVGWYPAAGVLFVHCKNKHSTPAVGCKPTVAMKMKYMQMLQLTVL